MPFTDPNTKAMQNLLFIGRFQVPHFGHFHVIKEALRIAQRVIIGIGSVNRPRSPKNPFTYWERVKLISECGIPEIKLAFVTGRIEFIPINDHNYNDQAWVKEVCFQVKEIVGTEQIGLIGCSKDESSYYLDMFPHWPSVKVPQHEMYHSTDIRGWWLDFGLAARRNSQITAHTTSEVCDQLDSYAKLPWFADLQSEVTANSVFKNSWKSAPYPPMFVTVDAVFEYQDHFLIIERGQAPFKGLQALPGGFLNQKEAIPAAILREAKEETGIDNIADYLQKVESFDEWGRDPRGRFISFVGYFVLPGVLTDYPVLAADDAKAVNWIHKSDIKAENMAFDHFFILRELTGKV